MSKFNFVILSKDEQFRINSEYAHDVSAKHGDVTFSFVKNNASPIAEVYNKFLNSDTESDFIVLMHADVKLDLMKLIDHIEQVSSKYDVMGLCGCAKFSISQTPLNWWNGSHPYPNDRWGCVKHGQQGNAQSFFSSHSPTVLDHEVACIDGLCIIISRKAINAGLRFDETLSKFDFYDTDISMQAVLKYHLKLGVLVQMDLEHYSLGMGITSSSFVESEKKFRDKWGFHDDQHQSSSIVH